MPTTLNSSPTPYAVLLRGVNVGGRAKVAMPRLRELVADLGYGEPRTYLNSGNVVLTAATTATATGADEAALGAELEGVIEQHFGFPVQCLARSAAYLRSVIDANPYAEQAAADGKLVHATFLSGAIDGERLSAVPPEQFAPEDYRVGDRVIYLSLPNGLGRSKLAVSLARPALLKGVTATTRNWNTVIKLAELMGA
ncbi:DUF1697 domain-containing protein [Streptomyces sp. SL13]|uniref:DUF1697 domain-containing protein n=1 Tax=Streptantibioticus silvisoli TaxID=2705255 RepID=A0AA90HEG8_9ACTN|nr:DUF1697 domain-containing protein [Streptantibioticus silvisoli]MDI5973432.1 DUF1697 domain-containing protein [Streptantibioticus silvisoli]